ncbi:YitT family protein [Octadecabacter sp. 1_MG-2023]|uniref:YitT family protein n=1 Tax=unclassified Octadecabacter TaxID=196158 RepID=UPI001C08C53E|nr:MULTISPECIES: YitT family protein [unclassified Octadecabacter]MBU2993162.1 YitT family protein [Octadecabacter sp. B2R22]MDO6733386.1 YitT family protein [Octadecabacter sp. 1_MG-2023]
MANTQNIPPKNRPRRHTLLEDAQGLVTGTGMAATGLVILTHLGLVTGQTAGLAMLLSYVTGYSFAVTFFLVNLPFYWLGYKRIGPRFVVKTLISVVLVSVFSIYFPMLMTFETLNPFYGVALFGVLTGAGLLAIFRHGASLGGVGILALYIQESTGFRAGYTQLLFDACIFGAAFFILDPSAVLLSMLGAFIVNMIITFNHRKDWYVAT